MSKPKLLLADDSITIQKLVNLTFADHGMDVVTFADGDSAAENLDAVKPDIVLADVNMPGMNGYQICELVRRDAANGNIPVVLLVGSFEPFDREEAERVGASAHLTKPFSSIAELVSTVNRLLDAPAAGVETADAETEERPTEEPAHEVSSPDEPGPETSDIDNLYHQSFAETAEMPKGGAEFEFEPMDLDDQMIQTSYVGDQVATEPEHELSESYPPAEDEPDHPMGAPTEQVDRPDDEPEPYVVAEPQMTESTPVDEIAAETPAPPVSANDPFESPARDLPPPSIETGLPDDTAASRFEESDLLELPSFGPRTSAPASPSNANQIASLSPELIELIVDKVVERLAQRNEQGNASSNTGS